MTDTAVAQAAPLKPSRLDNPWLRIPLIGVSFVFFAVILFWPAGRLDWVQGWAYLGLVVASICAAGLIVRRVNPELVKWRRRIGKNTKAWDRAWLPAYRTLSLTMLVIGALDAAGQRALRRHGPHSERPRPQGHRHRPVRARPAPGVRRHHPHLPRHPVSARLLVGGDPGAGHDPARRPAHLARRPDAPERARRVRSVHHAQALSPVARRLVTATAGP